MNLQITEYGRMTHKAHNEEVTGGGGDGGFASSSSLSCCEINL